MARHGAISEGCGPACQQGTIADAVSSGTMAGFRKELSDSLSTRDGCSSRLSGALHNAFQTGDPSDNAQLASMICLMERERAQQLTAARGTAERMGNLVCHFFVAQV